MAFDKQVNVITFKYGSSSFFTSIQENVKDIIEHLNLPPSVVTEPYQPSEFRVPRNSEIEFRGLTIKAEPDLIRAIMYSTRVFPLPCLDTLLAYISKWRKDYVYVLDASAGEKMCRIKNPYIAFIINDFAALSFETNGCADFISGGMQLVMAVGNRGSDFCNGTRIGKEYKICTIDKNIKLELCELLPRLLLLKTLRVERLSIESNLMSSVICRDHGNALLRAVVESGNKCVEAYNTP